MKKALGMGTSAQRQNRPVLLDWQDHAPFTTDPPNPPGRRRAPARRHQG